VPGAVAAPVLRRPSSRRAVLRSLAGLACAGTAGAAAYRHLPWRAWQADLSTATGTQRHIVLQDGSNLYLGAQSAVNLQFDASRRQLALVAGEILVATHADRDFAPARPFTVRTPHGTVRALGTRFTVRLDAGRTRVQVLEDAVEIRPAQASGRALRLHSGQQASFDALAVGARRPVPPGADAWTGMRLSVLHMPLQDVLAELARYRPGHLDCDPAVAQLQVSGVFPLDDTDAALATLAGSFPLRIQRATRYWIRVVPR